jgi:hypothetical protein
MWGRLRKIEATKWLKIIFYGICILLTVGEYRAVVKMSEANACWPTGGLHDH